MAIDYLPVEMANQMMRSALVLLDGAGEHDAAIKLQHAISIVERQPIPTTIKEMDVALDTPEARAILAGNI